MTGTDPHDLKCPITREIMSNPVCLDCGHNFEKEALTRWFSIGKTTCPLDRSEVYREEVSYNEELAFKIRDFVEENPECLHGQELDRMDDDLSRLQSVLRPLRREESEVGVPLLVSIAVFALNVFGLIALFWPDDG